MKAFKLILKICLCLILVALLAVSAVFFGYYPHYRTAKKPVEFTAAAREGEDIDVMSCNVRCLNPGDLGKRSWFYRADLIMKNIESVKPSIIGFQEVTKWQYKYLSDCMVGFDSVIEYRDETPYAEGCPIFYRTDCYTLVDKGSFWLSETPEKMSKDWGSACYRICSYVILKDNATEKEFVVFNTHLDHVSEEARINGIGVVLDKIAQFGGLPSMIMGDFNCFEGSVTYNKVTENFLDAQYQTENTMHGATYQAFGEKLDYYTIDFFMISKTGIKVSELKIINTTYDGVYPSDHFPIFAKFELD